MPQKTRFSYRSPRDESHRSYRMHDSKTRRRRPPLSLRGPLSGVSTHLRRRYVELPLSPCFLSMATPPALSFLRYRVACRCLSSPRASPPSKSPLFIANGFRIMMPGWLRDPIQIPRVSSSGPTRFLPRPPPRFLPLSPSPLPPCTGLLLPAA